MLKVLHTADWHLGQRLHQQSREYEHRRFLDWLLDQLEERAVDALVVAGDIFDSANPPVSALRRFYAFVTRARGRMPKLRMVFVAGNHDSPGRLESASSLLEMIGVHAIGAIRLEQGRLMARPMLIPLSNAEGREEVLCAAMPYLRPIDLPRVDVEGGDSLVEGVRRRHEELLRAALERKAPGQALLMTGHCYMVRGKVSELSERKILGGNQHALPLDLFPRDIDYVALGHLHLAQALEERVRYSGSPIPLSLAEESYSHQVLLATFEAGRLQDVEEIPVPRTVEILRVPEGGHAPPDELVALLDQLELDEALPPERHPFLEARVLLEQPEPGLWERISDLLGGRPVRLLKLTPKHHRSEGALADREERPDELEQLQPDEVFRLAWQERYEGDVPAETLERFHQLLQQAQEAGE